MTTWNEFAGAAESLAGKCEAKLDATGLSLVCTLRRDGWPRLSPTEPIITAGDLWLGMTWQSMKALDLRRDDRVLVHSTVSDRMGTEGEAKIYGRAVESFDETERDVYGVALEAKIGWRPEGKEWHLFRVAITQVAWVQIVEDKQHSQVWRPGEPLGPVKIAKTS